MPKETNAATTIHVPVSVIELFNKPTNKYPTIPPPRLA